MKRIGFIALIWALSFFSACTRREPVSGAYARLNGLNMYYETHGAGRPLVVLHGGGSTIQTTFGRILPILARERLVIAPEQQGHGHTADIDRPLSFEQMADDTAALLRHLNIESADVLGFSNGGNAGMHLARRHPRLVRKLVAASVFYKRSGIHPQILASFDHASAENMPALYRDAYLAVAPHPQNLPVLVSKLMANLRTCKDWSAGDLSGIRAPTLLLQADQDVASTEHILDLSRLIPHARLAVFPGGHGTYLGEALAGRKGSKVPELTAEMILEFLDEPVP